MAVNTKEINNPINSVGIEPEYTGNEIIEGIAKLIAFASIIATNAPDTPPPIIKASNGFLKRNATPYNAGSVIPIKAEIKDEKIAVLLFSFLAF